MAELVDVRLLREAFIDSGLSAREVAERMGWETKPRPDGERVKQNLGLTKERQKTGPRNYRKRTEYERALQLARAIGVDPHDVGL